MRTALHDTYYVIRPFDYLAGFALALLSFALFCLACRWASRRLAGDRLRRLWSGVLVAFVVGAALSFATTVAHFLLPIESLLDLNWGLSMLAVVSSALVLGSVATSLLGLLAALVLRLSSRAP